MDETDFAFRPNDIPWPDFACVSQKIPAACLTINKLLNAICRQIQSLDLEAALCKSEFDCRIRKIGLQWGLTLLILISKVG